MITTTITFDETQPGLIIYNPDLDKATGGALIYLQINSLSQANVDNQITQANDIITAQQDVIASLTPVEQQNPNLAQPIAIQPMPHN